MKVNLDFLGIGASVICAIHCAILPMLLSSLPLFGINIIHNSWFEALMILLALAIGSISLIHGYRKKHTEIFPLIFFSLGMGLLFARKYCPVYEVWLVPIALMGIVTAHIANFRLSRTHGRRRIMPENEN
ncbi:MAG: MerC domain-containing protein [Chitinophagales bacterium]